MTGASLVMPMAGRGSRFMREGIVEPKPLIDLHGRPFFWWAVESVRRMLPIEEMVFVVLQEHIVRWKIDQCIQKFYPSASIVALPDVTSGSAETAALGVAELKASLPLIVNDCDHAFEASGLPGAAEQLSRRCDGMLMTFRSESPNYSFVRLGPAGEITGTIEKVAASPFAIAGCYLFRSPALFRAQYLAYLRTCPYAELFISGMYDQMLRDKLRVGKVVLDEHFAFGTPEEFAAVTPRMEDRLAGWR